MNQHTALKVCNLSKKFRLGEKSYGYKTLRDTFAESFGKLRKGVRKTAAEAESQEFWALRDISFEVKQGETVGIIGRNGAGKSTLLKILSRITEPSGGTVDLYGKVGSLLEVGTGFHLELTGRENIFLSGAILGMKKADIIRQFDEIVAFAEIEKFVDTPVKHYSSGMYLRLAFGVAAHLQPNILLVDEVLAVGDMVFQQKCLGKMNDVAKQGRTVLFVSHNMSAVQELCRRGIMIDAGRIAFDGITANCIGEYYKVNNHAEEVVHDSKSPMQIWGIKINEQFSPVINNDSGFTVSLNLRAKMIRNPSIVLIVENVTGQQVIHSKINTGEIGLETLNGKQRLQVSVPPLWLSPGVYSAYFKLLIPSLNSSGRMNSERILIELRGDFDGTGKTLLCPKTEWSIVDFEKKNGHSRNLSNEIVQHSY